MSATVSANDSREPESEERATLEREAEAAKAKLLQTLERLDEKRHDAVETAVSVRNDLLVVGVLGGLALGILIGEVRLRSMARKRRRPLVWLRAAEAGWKAFRRAA